MTSQEKAVPFIVAVPAAVAVLLFGLLVPAGLRAIGTGSSRWAGGSLALGIAAPPALPVSFWSGLPLMLGVAAGLLGADSRRVRRTGPATAALVIGVLVVVADVVTAPTPASRTTSGAARTPASAASRPACSPSTPPGSNSP